jgi:hypothetical protein
VSFVQYSGLGGRLYNNEEAYRASERQRLILRNVCSAWRVWAASRKTRYMVMTDTGIPLEVILNAVRVPLLAGLPALGIRNDKPFRWRIIDARIHFGSPSMCFNHLSLHGNNHPLLRRINLSLSPRMKELSEVIRCLTAFKHLTYLSLELRDLSPATENSTTPTCVVTLPNVQVLEYLSDVHVPTLRRFKSRICP